MGYTELCNAIVLSAVKDYTHMYKTCKKLHIYEPEKYFTEHWKNEAIEDSSNGDYSLFNILKWGLDAKNFLLDDNELTLYTNLDGERLIKMAENNVDKELGKKHMISR